MFPYAIWETACSFDNHLLSVRYTPGTVLPAREAKCWPWGWKSGACRP